MCIDFLIIGDPDTGLKILKFQILREKFEPEPGFERAAAQFMDPWAATKKALH